MEEERRRIDELDAQLVQLLNQRAKCVCRIGELKRQSKMPVYEPAREQSVFENVRNNNHGPLSHADLIQLYERIIDVMRKIQRDQISETRTPENTTELEPND
jgi:chorismate mutase